MNVLHDKEIVRLTVYPKKVKTDYKNIEWRRLIGFRNRIVHEYFGIDYAMVWKIKEENIPQPIEFIKKLINDTHYTSLFSTFFLDKKSGAKKSRPP